MYNKDAPEFQSGIPDQQPITGEKKNPIEQPVESETVNAFFSKISIREAKRHQAHLFMRLTIFK